MGNWIDFSTVHKGTVHKGTKINCEKCNFQDTSKANIKIHKETVHEANKFKDNLKKHKDTVHKVMKIKRGSGRLNCELCTKKFNKIETFNKHQKRIHNKCNNCEKIFQLELKTHLRQEHEERDNESSNIVEGYRKGNVIRKWSTTMRKESRKLMRYLKFLKYWQGCSYNKTCLG